MTIFPLWLIIVSGHWLVAVWGMKRSRDGGADSTVQYGITFGLSLFASTCPVLLFGAAMFVDGRPDGVASLLFTFISGVMHLIGGLVAALFVRDRYVSAVLFTGLASCIAGVAASGEAFPRV